MCTGTAVDQCMFYIVYILVNTSVCKVLSIYMWTFPQCQCGLSVVRVTISPYIALL